jgi:ATP-dependent RNA helicase DBP3
MQTQAVLDEFCPLVHLQSVVIYGGVPKSTQKAALRQQVDAIVATPGRLQDLIQDGSIDLSQVEYVVLDEADRMLECGFEEEVRNILSNCPDKSQRQTCMFSATWPAVIQKIAMEYMIHPVRVYVGFAPITQSGKDDGGSGDNASDVHHHDMVLDDSLSANKRVQQIIEVVEDRQREERLRQLLRQYQSNSGKTNKNKSGDNMDRILVFCLYKKEAERLEITLQRGGWNCSSIHGNKNQAARTQALSQFKDGSVPLLVATDVAARGLDIPDVQLVVNFTFPLTIEDYVHRIGRTGRQGKTGVAHTFFQPTDKGHAGELQAVLRQAGQAIPEALAKFGSTIKRKEHKLYGNFGPKGGAAGEPMKKATKITFNYSDDEN